MVATFLRGLLKEPMTRSIDVNASEMSVAHRQVLLKKKCLRRMFQGFYSQCRTLDERYFGEGDGLRVEIGSGSSIIKEFLPDVTTTDIKPLPFVDMVVDAQEMPFDNNSVRALYGINVFHHLPQPRSFFRELVRVLEDGGGVVLIEPYHGPVARWLFTRLHDCEYFDLNGPWENTRQKGPCLDANQALSGIIFHRDRILFEQEFPDLECVVDVPHTQLSYLLSGGVNFRQLVPDWAYPAVSAGEKLLSPLNHWIALQHTIVLRKRFKGAMDHAGKRAAA